MADQELAGLPEIQRWRATGDYAYPAEECEDGEFVAYDDHRAELLRLTARVRELQQSLDRLHGARFSDRVYAVLKDRVERAEAELAALKRKIAEAPVVRAMPEGRAAILRVGVGFATQPAMRALEGQRVALRPVGGE